MENNNELTLVANKKGYRLLDICYKNQVYSEKIDEIEKTNIVLVSKVENLYSEKIDLLHTKLCAIQNINFEILTKKMNMLSYISLALVGIFFVPMIYIISICQTFLYQILSTILCGTSIAFLINMASKKIDKSFLKKQNKKIEKFENTKGKEIEEKIISINKKIETIEKIIHNNQKEISELKKKVKLCSFYLKQYKSLTDKMCKVKKAKVFNLNKENSLQSNEKVKTLKLNKSVNY